MATTEEIQFRDPAARVAAGQPIYSAPVGSPNEDLHGHSRGLRPIAKTEKK
ncbi:MAG: hypothetical protein M3Y82_03950 [Verrucomicrobiota bacterium]|nr:hypothetical protein [Verrucomicrobiota bacterium]